MKNKPKKINNTSNCADAEASSACIVIPPTLRKPYSGAYKKGYLCALDGGDINENPYGDDRTYHGSVTFVRGFWKAWVRGFKAYKQVV